MSGGSRPDATDPSAKGILELAKAIHAADPGRSGRERERRLVEGGGFTRPKRSETRAPRRIEFEPGVDVGRDSFRFAGERSAASRIASCGRRSPPRGTRGRDRGTL